MEGRLALFEPLGEPSPGEGQGIQVKKIGVQQYLTLNVTGDYRRGGRVSCNQLADLSRQTHLPADLYHQVRMGKVFPTSERP